MEAIRQSKRYLANGFIKYDEKILDGYKDGGRNSQIYSDGQVVGGTREILCVDRKKDKRLQKIIDSTKKRLANVRDNDTKAKYISELCKSYNRFDESKLPCGKEMLLGDIIGTRSACCRHLSLLFKILCDEVGIKCELIRGDYEQPYNSKPLGHAWNVYVNDENRLVLHDSMTRHDPMQYIDSYISNRMDYLRSL